ncbi:MAG: chromosome segregation ATPase [Synechococcales cyanobacterium C42_A2020_086]|nr:chromosome segregation ATPase [Synechococcales cyanobacterium C42_A2020_086]
MTGKHDRSDHRPDGSRKEPPSQPLSEPIPPLRMPPAPRLPLVNPTPKDSVSSQLPAFRPLQPLPAEPPLQSARHRRRVRLPSVQLPKNWLFWGGVLMLGFTGAGILSVLVLLRLPSLPNCPAIFWPTASASLRIYCAQLAADKRTVKDLLHAISLVDDLPQDHPLRPEIDRNIEAWSREVLELAEETFHAGDLAKAIQTARKIPANTEAHQLVDQRIQSWETIWRNAEKIYRDAEDALRRRELRQAFRLATGLLSVGNRHWETTKYRELNTLITETRIDSNKIDKAKGLAEQGGVTNLLAAIKLMEEIQPKSHLHAEAQRLIRDFGRDMLTLAESALDRRQYDEAISILSQIPDKAELQEEIRDFNILAEAQSQAWGGTTADIESAIVHAQRIKRDRPLYGKAQQLISNWQLEIQDVAFLDRAHQLAQPGTPGDLRAAIAEAERIPFGNPRRQEAEQAIARWTAQIETIDDQPYLDRAEQLASAGDVESLQAAITEAGRIRPGRALYEKASQRIDQWTVQIQRAQDQPQLDRARQLANMGDLEAAITVAEQISPSRALYDEAQADVNRWRAQLQETQDQPQLDRARQLASQGFFADAIAVAEQIPPGRTLYEAAQADIQSWRSQSQGQDQLKQAYTAASMGTPAMLAAAIELANQIPTSHPSRRDAERLINQWSYQLLRLAESQARLNPTAAIAIAETIPANSAAYPAAQRQIQAWQQPVGP